VIVAYFLGATLYIQLLFLLGFSWNWAICHCRIPHDTVRQKNNFAKYITIFKILSLLDTAQKLLQNDHYIANLTFKKLLHFPAKPQCRSYWQFSGRNKQSLTDVKGARMLKHSLRLLFRVEFLYARILIINWVKLAIQWNSTYQRFRLILHAT